MKKNAIINEPEYPYLTLLQYFRAMRIIILSADTTGINNNTIAFHETSEVTQILKSMDLLDGGRIYASYCCDSSK